MATSKVNPNVPGISDKRYEDVNELSKEVTDNLVVLSGIACSMDNQLCKENEDLLSDVCTVSLNQCEHLSVTSVIPESKCKACGLDEGHKYSRRICPAIGKRCRKCFKSGHFASVCQVAQQCFECGFEYPHVVVPCPALSSTKHFNM